MKVFTFYSPVEGKRERDELALIDLWKQSWEALGWEPVVLGYESLDFDEELEEMARELKKLPSINKHNLDYWCYLRWIAVAQQGGGFMSDYDVINYSFEPREAGELTIYDRYVPCMVSGTRDEFLRAIRWFADERPKWWQVFRSDAHTSDMLILKKHESGFKQGEACVEYGVEGWATAPAVHFCNRVMKPTALLPRHEHIDRLRKLPEGPGIGLD
ncbi:MAG: hypothetical protein WA771_07415 [Chthoniobacterales bacterium]